MVIKDMLINQTLINDMNKNELLEFAKWFVHSRRKKFKYQDNVNATEFASNLMTELCYIEPFSNEHPLIKEYNEQKEN